MNNVFFFDLDGTLWDHKSNIPESTKTALCELHEKGNLLFICTGRTKGFLNVPDLWKLPFDGGVFGCGTHIEYKDYTFNQMLQTEQIDHIRTACSTYNILPILEGPEYMYIDSSIYENPYMSNMLWQYQNEAKSATMDINKIFIQKATCLYSPKSDCKGFNKELSSSFNVIAREFVTEIVPTGFSKSSGIKKVLEILDIDVSHSFAFGDSENDTDMLKYAGCGIAMGNATEEAKQAADKITDSIDNDGIYKAVKSMNFI